MKTELEKAKKGLENAHKYLQKAIDKNDAQDENYYFDAVFRYAELVARLEEESK